MLRTLLLPVLRTLLLLLFTCCLAMAAPQPQLRNQADPNSNQRLLLNPEGTRLLVVEERRAFLWDLNRQRLIHTLKGFNYLLEAQFSPDSRSLVVSDSPRWIGCYDVSGDKLVKRWEFRDTRPFKTKVDAYSLQYSPDGKYLLAVGNLFGVGAHDDVVRVLESASGKVVQAYPGWSLDRTGNMGDFAFTPDSQGFVRLVKGRLQHYALPGGKKTAEVDLKLEGSWLKPHPGGVLVVSSQGRDRLMSTPGLRLLEERQAVDEVEPVSPDGRLSWSRAQGKLQVKDEQGQLVYEGGAQEYVHYWVPGGGFGLNYSPGFADGFPQLRDAKGQQLSAEFISSSSVAGGIGWTEPGYGGPTSLFDLSNGARLLDLPFAYALEVSRNGKILAVLLKDGVWLLDLPATLQKGQPVPLLP